MISRKTLSGGHGCTRTPHVPTVADTIIAMSDRASNSSRNITTRHVGASDRQDTEVRLADRDALSPALCRRRAGVRVLEDTRGTNDCECSARHRIKSLSFARTASISWFSTYSVDSSRNAAYA